MLVTGASSGIGRATAIALAARGDAVWLTYANDGRGRPAEAVGRGRRAGLAAGPAAVARPGRQLDDRPARAALVASVPLGRFGEPVEVAPTIALLASPESSYTTGSTYDVSGGVRID